MCTDKMACRCSTSPVASAFGRKRCVAIPERRRGRSCTARSIRKALKKWCPRRGYGVTWSSTGQFKERPWPRSWWRGTRSRRFGKHRESRQSGEINFAGYIHYIMYVSQFLSTVIVITSFTRCTSYLWGLLVNPNACYKRMECSLLIATLSLGFVLAFGTCFWISFQDA